jgi:hypothetical protein
MPSKKEKTVMAGIVSANTGRLRRWAGGEGFVDLAGFLLIYYFLLGIFPSSLILSDTFTTGGDMGSHQYPAMYMRDYLLPNLKLTGWSMDWYAGFPAFEFYFPIPFAAIALLSYLIKFQVAFKLITVLGVFMFPAVTYASMRLMDFRFPMPIIAAAFSLNMLFNEEYSMWGGNIKSTLAGEFTFTIGFALAVLFLGLAYAYTSTRRYFKSSVLVLAAIPMCHVYTLIWAALSVLGLMFSRNAKVLLERVNRLWSVCILGFMLSAFWTMNIISKFSWATPFGAWRTQSLMEVVPSLLLPFYFLGAVSIVLFLIEPKRNLGFLIFMTLTPVALFFIIHSGITEHLLDVRFMPFAYLGLLFMSAEPVSRLVLRFRAPGIAALIVVMLTLLWVGSNKMMISAADEYLKGQDTKASMARIYAQLESFKYEGDVPGWVRWNYEGFEAKNTWDGLKQFFDYLNTLPKGRIAHEFSSSHESFGTPRALELLPFFTKHPVLEGLNIESSISSPYHFYMQSEYSVAATCPLSYMRCTRFNLPDAVKHFRYFSPVYVVASSQTLKDALDAEGGFTHLRSLPYDLDVYSVDNPSPTVEVPDYNPVMVETSDWKVTSMRWWKRPDSVDVPVVWTRKSTTRDRLLFSDIVAERDVDFDLLPRTPAKSGCVVNYTVYNERVDVETSCPGVPHLVKVSYNPGWKVEGANEIYLAGPAMMLVFPNSNKFSLYYGLTTVDAVALSLTYLGVVILLYCWLKDKPGIGKIGAVVLIRQRVDAAGMALQAREERALRALFSLGAHWKKVFAAAILIGLIAYALWSLSSKNAECASTCVSAGYLEGSALFPYSGGSLDHYHLGYNHAPDNIAHKLQCTASCDPTRGEFAYVNQGHVIFSMASEPGRSHKLTFRVDDSGSCRTMDVYVNQKFIKTLTTAEDPIGWTEKSIILPAGSITTKEAVIDLKHNSSDCLGFDVAEVWLTELNCECS